MIRDILSASLRFAVAVAVIARCVRGIRNVASPVATERGIDKPFRVIPGPTGF